MLWIPGRRALANPIFCGGVEEFLRHQERWSQGLHYLIVLAVVLFVTWPKEGFIRLRDFPLTYNVVGSAIVIILAYLSLSQGARKTLGSVYVSLHDWLRLAPMGAGAFLRGYLAAGMVELLFFWGLSLPFLVVAAGVAGEPLAHVGAGLLVIVVCGVSYRMVGVALLTWLERYEFTRYILVRLLYVFFVLGSGFVMPVWNPVLAFVDTSIWPRRAEMVVLSGWGVQGWRATVVLHLLLGGLCFIIASIRVRGVQRRARARRQEE